MDKRWIAALASGAALLLGACSSDNAAGPPTGGVGEPDPGGTDSGGGSGADPDGGGADPDAGGAEPTALERAYEAADAAVRAATEAAGTAASADTQAARDRALKLIVDARGKLDDVVDAARDALDAAEGSAARGAATRARDAAIEYEAEQMRILDRAHGSTGWAGRSAVATELPGVPEVGVVHTLRRAADSSDAATLLKAEDVPPIMYEVGKTVMAPGRAGSGDRLRMRGMPLTQSANTSGERYVLGYAYGHSSMTHYFVSRDLSDIQDNRSPLVAGLTITRDGLAVDIGGKHAEGWDFRTDFGLSYTQGDFLAPWRVPQNQTISNGYDLALTFGRPSASPQGIAEHYWLAELMPTEAQAVAAANRGGWLTDGDRTLPLGVYDVRLSNHIGTDANLEDPAGPAYPDDDQNFYLSYAAYGFMDFYRPGTTLSMGTIQDGRGLHRVFPFQVGYDAFADEDGKRTTDIAEAITGGTFKGRTLAEEFSYFRSGSIAVIPFLSPTDTKRMRGDVELTATISGADADNTITGKITNMEDWDARGYWKDSTTITADIRFHTDGSIDAKGEFTGTFANYPTGFDRGGYRGNFYGPHDNLEAAGTWVMSPVAGRRRAIAGSFGAALVREDGSYGTTVAGGD